MKIVFFGSPASALPSLNKIKEEGHDIILAITQPDRPSGRGKKRMASPVKKRALELNIPVYQPERIRKAPETFERFQALQQDLNVVVAYGQIIPSNLIYFPRFHSINVHFSLLPKYRGASPVQWALLNGERKTGITIFELNERMDEGDILAQRETEILPEETSSMLEARLASMGADLLVSTIAQIASIPREKQDHSLATFAPKIRKEDGRMDWTEDARDLERKIRAFSPWPSAYAYFGGRILKIIQGVYTGTKTPGFNTGQVISIDKAGISVACGGGSVLLIKTLQPENKKVMDAHAFSLGAQIKPGMELT